MPNIYVRSTDGSDSDNGSTWALAKATLEGAVTIAVAGDTIYVSDNHSETGTTAMTLASAGTAASPIRIICGDDAAEPPTALATTAVVERTTSADHMSFNGFAYCYGITYQLTASANFSMAVTVPTWWRFENCKFINTSNTVSDRFNIGGSGSGDDFLVEFINCEFQYGNVAQQFQLGERVFFQNCTFAASGAVPTELFEGVTIGGKGCELTVRGCDLSNFGSGESLVNVSRLAYGDVLIANCKIGAIDSLTAGTNPGQGGWRVRLVNCDSGDTNYRYQLHRYEGDVYSDATVTRSSGASDGTTPISRRMVSSANAKTICPLTLDDIVVWNETLSAMTATIEIATDNVTLTDQEIWIEVEYLGTSGSTRASFVNDRDSLDHTLLAGAASNQDSSSVTWNSVPGTPVKQKLVSPSFTPAEKGPIRCRVHLAKASTTVYVDPLVTLA